MNKTDFSNISNQEAKWYLVDVKDLLLGRVATQVAKTLMGKTEVNFTKNLPSNTHVIIVNADKIQVTGNKAKQKLYYRHSGRPGGLKIRTFSEIKDTKPEFLLERSIKGMLPKGKHGRALFRNLKVYKDEKHPHEAQKPCILKF